MSNLYKVVLVDDEDDVRGRVGSKITKESGFEVVGKAGNGYDALELVEELKPDVVITDIKMPFINGIELARILRRDYPTVKLGFISGYDEFDYAREAIELNVISYIMKPITTEDLEKFLRKLKDLLDEEKTRIADTEALRSKYNKYIPKITDASLNSFTYKEVLDPSDLDTLKDLGLNIIMNQFAVATVEVDGNISDEAVLSIKGIVDDSLEDLGLVTSFRTRAGLAILSGSLKKYSKNELDNYLFKVASYIEEYLGIDVTIGVSSIFENLLRLPEMYFQSITAKNHGLYYKIGSIVFFDDIDSTLIENVSIDESILRDFDNAIKFYSDKQLEQYLRSLKDRILSDDKHHYNRQYLVLNVANRVIKFSESISSGVLSSKAINDVLAFKDIDELFAWVYQSIISIKEENSNSQVNKVESLVESAFTIIEEKYNDNSLSLESVAEDLDISVSYLSSLIKKYKKLTFNKYLIKVRMEKAIELITYSNEKIVNIAELVGYNEVYYFSHSFKKFTSMSPKEYRKTYGNT